MLTRTPSEQFQATKNSIPDEPQVFGSDQSYSEFIQDKHANFVSYYSLTVLVNQAEKQPPHGGLGTKSLGNVVDGKLPGIRFAGIVRSSEGGRGTSMLAGGGLRRSLGA